MDSTVEAIFPEHPGGPYLLVSACTCLPLPTDITYQTERDFGSCLGPMPLEQLLCVEELRLPSGDPPRWGPEASCPSHHVAHLWPTA